MKRSGLMAGVVLLGGLLGSTAFGQMELAPLPDEGSWSQAITDNEGDYFYDESYYTGVQQDAPSESPSDVPAAEEESPAQAVSGCCDPCCPRCRPRCDTGCRQCRPWKLRQPCLLKRHGIEIGGWIDQGVGVVANNPVDRFNGPVTFVDRDGEWQVNQVWLYMERPVDTGGCGWDIGGRVDLMYGTDAAFTQAVDGLEADWDQTERFYQAALPQFYADVAYNNLTVRMGHFFTILGYERVPAPDNFFYSHAYTMQYAEPFTHTGMLAMYDLSDRLSVSAGLHRGLDQFNDTDGHDTLGFVGGAKWASWNERMTLAFALSATEQRPLDELFGARLPDAKVVAYSLVGTFDLTKRLTYVAQHDLIQTVSPDVPGVGTVKAEAYGINQYLLYEINPCWSAGLRFEWFRDDDGAYVFNKRVNDPLDPVLGSGFVGDFYEVSLGLNWRPHANITVRPEVRWDWFDGTDMGPLALGGGSRVGPYDSGGRDDQFLWACDVICTF